MDDTPYLDQQTNQWVIANTHEQLDLLTEYIQHLQKSTNERDNKAAFRLESRVVNVSSLTTLVEDTADGAGYEFVNLNYVTASLSFFFF